MQRKKILIVDDNQIILKTLMMKLKAHGYDVITASDGSGAVSVARRERPDLLLLDISFPPDVGHGGGVPWDGFLIMNWLKRLGDAGQIPIIIITGGQETECKARALAAGAVSFFQKPLDHEKLMVAIDETLASHVSTGQAPEPGGLPGTSA